MSTLSEKLDVCVYAYMHAYSYPCGAPSFPINCPFSIYIHSTVYQVTLVSELLSIWKKTNNMIGEIMLHWSECKGHLQMSYWSHYWWCIPSILAFMDQPSLCSRLKVSLEYSETSLKNTQRDNWGWKMA